MNKKILIAFALSLPVFAGCHKEDVPGGGEFDGMGRIELSLSAGDDVVVTESTKALVELPDFADLSFTISGVTGNGDIIEDQPIEFSESESTLYSYFCAGTYTLSARYQKGGDKAGCNSARYSGTSGEFTVETGKVAGPVHIDLMSDDARIVIEFDPLLDRFYGTSSVMFSSPLEVTVNSSDECSEGGNHIIYMEAGRVAAYGISCTPLPDSGASPISLSGLYLPGAVGAEQAFLEAGKSYTLRVKAVPGGIAVFLNDDDTPIYTTEELWNGMFS